MKLSVTTRVLVVASAEAACLQAHVARVDARRAVKAELLRVATPPRIVGAGFAAGVAAGLLPARAKATATGPLGHLFGMAIDSLLPSLMAGFAAAQAAGEEVEAAAGDVADEVAEEVVDEVAAGVAGAASAGAAGAARR